MIGDAANFTSAGRTHWGWIIAIFILLLLLPAVFDTHTPTLLGIWALFALSLGLMWGYAGILSFGHAAYFGLGAYTYATAQNFIRDVPQVHRLPREMSRCSSREDHRPNPTERCRHGRRG